MRKAIATTCLVTPVSSYLFAAAGRIELHMSDASAVVALDGARVLSYFAGGREVLWQPRGWKLKSEKWTHGGMPILWPWCGSGGPDPKVKHGLVWKHRFTVRERGASHVVLGWSAPAGSFELFPYAFDLLVTVRLSGILRVELRTKNTGTEPFPFLCGTPSLFRARRT